VARFQPGHTGKPKGARNKLTNDFLVALAADFAEHGAKAIKIMRIEEPAAYVKVVASILPKEITFENATTDMDDDALEELIVRIREHLLTQRQEEPVLIEAKADVAT
jgi:hypothetical protein